MYLRFWAAVLMTVVPAVPAADSEILPPVFGPISLRPFLGARRRGATVASWAGSAAGKPQLGRSSSVDATIQTMVAQKGAD